MYFNYLTFYRRLAPREFNSYGSRRGNDAVMARGTFANIRLVNKFIGKAAPKTLHFPSGDTVRWKLYLDSCNLFPKVRLFFPLWPACWNSRAALNQPYVFSLWRRLTYVYVVPLSLLASIVIGLWRDRVKPTTRSAYLHLLCTCFVVVVLSVLIGLPDLFTTVLLQMDIFDAAERYRQEGRQLIILAGKDYGSGSSRDWAAKGPWMQVNTIVGK